MKSSFVFTILAFCFFLSNVISQESVIKEVTTESLITNLEDQIRIEGKTVEFKNEIHELELDSIQGKVNIILRAVKGKNKYSNFGDVLSFDLKSEELIFSREIVFALKGYNFVDDKLIITKANKSRVVEATTGKFLWKVEDPFFYLFKDKDVGLCYRKGMQKVNNLYLEGYDLNNGRFLWDRKIDKTYGWRELRLLNDSTLIVNASGLHTVNFRDGTGWDYEGKVGNKKFNYWWGANNIIYNICSNALIDSTSITYASSNSLVRLDLDGNILWERDLDVELSSKSVLFLVEDKLIFINLGKADSNIHVSQQIGKPFLSVYNPEDGSLFYKKNLYEDGEYVNHYTHDDDYLYLLSSERIEKRSLEDGEILERYISPNIKESNNTFFLNELFHFVTPTDSLSSLGSKESESIYLVHAGHTVFAINKSNLTFKKIGIKSALYLPTDKKNDYNLICKEEAACYILDKDTNPIYKIDEIKSARLIGDYFIGINGKKLHYVSLSDLSKMKLGKE